MGFIPGAKWPGENMAKALRIHGLGFGFVSAMFLVDCLLKKSNENAFRRTRK